MYVVEDATNAYPCFLIHFLCAVFSLKKRISVSMFSSFVTEKRKCTIVLVSVDKKVSWYFEHFIYICINHQQQQQYITARRIQRNNKKYNENWKVYTYKYVWELGKA